MEYVVPLTRQLYDDYDYEYEYDDRTLRSHKEYVWW